MSPGSKILLALFVMGLVTYLPYHVIKHDSGVEYRRLQASVEEMEAGNELLRRENTRLRAHIEAYRTDPRLLERRARERLLVARPDEKILVFPPDEPRPVPVLPPEEELPPRPAPKAPKAAKAAKP